MQFKFYKCEQYGYFIAPYKRTYTTIAYFLGQHQSFVANYEIKNTFRINARKKNAFFAVVVFVESLYMFLMCILIQY